MMLTSYWLVVPATSEIITLDSGMLSEVATDVMSCCKKVEVADCSWRRDGNVNVKMKVTT